MKKHKKTVLGFFGAFAIALGFGLIVYEISIGFHRVSLPERVFFSDVTQDLVQPVEHDFETVEDFVEWIENKPRSTVFGHYLAGRFASSMNDIQQAASEISQGLDLDPENGFLISRAFPSLLAAGEIEQALELAYAVDPYNALVAHLATSVQLADALKLGDADTARALAESYKSTGFGEYLKPLAQAWIDVMTGQSVQAINDLEKMSAKTPQMQVLYELHVAFIHDYLGNKDKAKHYYLKVFDENPSIRTGWLASQFLLLNDEPQEAVDVLAKIKTSATPSSFVPYAIQNAQNRGLEGLSSYIETPADGFMSAIFDLSSVLKQENSNRLALLYARIAQYLNASDPFINLLIADIYEGKGLAGRALEYYERFDSSSDFYVMAMIRRAEILEEQERFDDAADLLQMLADYDVVSEKVMMSLGDLYRRHEQFSRAIKIYSHIIDQHDGQPSEEDWVVYYARGMCYEQSDQWPKAEADLSKALELSPDQPYVLNYLGYSWADKGVHVEQALAYIQRAIAQKPYDGYIVDSMGWALHRLGRIHEAIPYMERAIQLVPNDPIINDHLGDVYWHVGRKVEAMYQWQRALKVTEDSDDKAVIEAKLLDGLSTEGFSINHYAGADVDSHRLEGTQ